MNTPRPIAECTEADLKRFHALVYGRCKIWFKRLSDDHAREFVWSRWAWWKAMHYDHRGPPCYSANWGMYAGSEGFTGPGDAEITHFLPMPDAPEGAPVGITIT